MNVLTKHDEFLHLGYPLDLEHEWKENYYFNFVDAEAKASGIIHFSIRRKAKKAAFTVKGSLDGDFLSYTNVIAWPPEPGVTSEQRVVSDGKMSLEIIEPHRQHRVTLQSEKLSLDLSYKARFTVYQYAHDDSVDDKSMNVEHYEQGMSVEGEISAGGKQIDINCLAHRDHSWGFRNETTVGGWNWIAVQFPSSTLNFSQVRRHGLPDLEQGFISTDSGNRKVTAVEVVSVNNDEEGKPVGGRYVITLEDGSTMTFVAEMFDRVVLPVGRDGTTVYYENFSHFTHEESGERGTGIDEHMVNL